MQSKGTLVVISGPSGSGKGTVVKRLREIMPEVSLSVSATTRKFLHSSLFPLRKYHPSVFLWFQLFCIQKNASFRPRIFMIFF